MMTTVRTGARIVVALVSLVLGALLTINGCGVLWSLLAELRRLPGTTKPYFWIRVGTITLEGWQVYAAGALLVISGIGLLVVGFSLFSQLDNRADSSSAR